MGKRRNLLKPVKDKEGRTLNKEVEQRSRWEEHFKEILNTDPRAERPDIQIAEMLLSVNTNPPSKAEISRALKMLKDRKMPGPDGTPPEALKADPITTTDTLHHLFLKIWEQEKVPTDWKNGYLEKQPKKGDLGIRPLARDPSAPLEDRQMSYDDGKNKNKTQIFLFTR